MTSKFGYAGIILNLDLSLASTKQVPTDYYSERFIGGKGIATKIYWDEVNPEVNSLDPENRLIFITGPLAGIPGLSASRCVICGKSPVTTPEYFYFGYLGGKWPSQLKFAGYDGIIIQGKSEKPVYLLIKDGKPELRDASHLWGKNSIEVRNTLKSELGNSAGVLSIGPAGENLVSLATMLAEDDSTSTGFGAVMGSKKLKAIVILGGNSRPVIARPEKLQDLIKYCRKLKPDGSADFFKWLQLPKPFENMKIQHCFGCLSGCSRATYKASNGDEGRLFCHAGVFYKWLALNYYKEPNEVSFYATRLCDSYGIDIKAVHMIIEWLSKCYGSGILTDDNTGIPLSMLGSLEFIETLVRKISFREGFGNILAQGIHKAAAYVGNKANELISDNVDKTGQDHAYCPRRYIITGIFYAMEPRQPVAQLHAVSRLVVKWMNTLNGLEGSYLSSEVFRGISRKFWGSEIACDFSTYEGKAQAARMIQDREYAIECLILCNQLWPMMDVEFSESHVGDSTLESQIFSAVMGNDVNEEGFYQIGERILNLQRAILIREGHKGRHDDKIAEFNYTVPVGHDHMNPQCLVPGKDGKPISRKGAVVDRKKFNQMLDEYYHLRAWDVSTGLQTETKLIDLGLSDIARELKQRGQVL